MRQPNAIAASTAKSTALRFSTGSAPGRPRQTGQTLVFGGAPKRVEHEQKILDTVNSWTCTSSPITGSYLARAPAAVSGVVAISSDYKGFAAIGPSRSLVKLGRRAQVFLQCHIEIHQFVALCIMHPGQIEMRARQRCGNSRDVEEQEAGLRTVRF